MRALNLVTTWPVEHVTAAVVTAGTPSSNPVVETIGDVDRRYRLASLSKPIVAWAVMIGVEEGIVDLDTPLDRNDVLAGTTMRHLLAHAAGFGFDGEAPISGLARTRIYSNTGFERAAAVLADAAEMPAEEYLRDAVFEPLGMASASLRGSAAHGVVADLTDTARFVAEMLRPRLVAEATWQEITRTQYPELAGIVPNVGRFDPCPWGLGVEIRGAKSPHWTGASNSASTFGHFGGSGTMMWVDASIGTGLVALTDRRFVDWSEEALVAWPALSDAVIAEERLRP